MIIFEYKPTLSSRYRIHAKDGRAYCTHADGTGKYLEWLSRICAEVNKKLSAGVNPEDIYFTFGGSDSEKVGHYPRAKADVIIKDNKIFIYAGRYKEVEMNKSVKDAYKQFLSVITENMKLK